MAPSARESRSALRYIWAAERSTCARRGISVVRGRLIVNSRSSSSDSDLWTASAAMARMVRESSILQRDARCS